MSISAIMFIKMFNSKYSISSVNDFLLLLKRRKIKKVLFFFKLDDSQKFSHLLAQSAAEFILSKSLILLVNSTKSLKISLF